MNFYKLIIRLHDLLINSLFVKFQDNNIYTMFNFKFLYLNSMHKRFIKENNLKNFDWHKIYHVCLTFNNIERI